MVNAHSEVEEFQVPMQQTVNNTRMQQHWGSLSYPRPVVKLKTDSAGQTLGPSGAKHSKKGRQILKQTAGSIFILVRLQRLPLYILLGIIYSILENSPVPLLSLALDIKLLSRIKYLDFRTSYQAAWIACFAG